MKRIKISSAPIDWRGNVKPFWDAGIPGYQRIGLANTCKPADWERSTLRLGADGMPADADLIGVEEEHGNRVGGVPTMLDSRYAVEFGGDKAVKRDVERLRLKCRSVRAGALKVQPGRVELKQLAVGLYTPGPVLLSGDNVDVWKRAVAVYDSGGILSEVDFLIVDGHPHFHVARAERERQLSTTVLHLRERVGKDVQIVACIAEHYCTGPNDGVYMPEADAVEMYKFARKLEGVTAVARFNSHHDGIGANPAHAAINEALGVKS